MRPKADATRAKTRNDAGLRMITSQEFGRIRVLILGYLLFESPS
jgi:hypothetical protein